MCGGGWGGGGGGGWHAHDEICSHGLYCVGIGTRGTKHDCVILLIYNCWCHLQRNHLGYMPILRYIR